MNPKLTILQHVYRQSPEDQRRMLVRIHMRLALEPRSPAGKGNRANRRRLALWCIKVEHSVANYFSQIESGIELN